MDSADYRHMIDNLELEIVGLRIQREALLQALRNTVAMSETMLAHYCAPMPTADLTQRTKELTKAKQLITQVEGK